MGGCKQVEGKEVLRRALYAWLKSQGLKKTSKALKKECDLKDAKGECKITLTKLFERLEQEITRRSTNVPTPATTTSEAETESRDTERQETSDSENLSRRAKKAKVAAASCGPLKRLEERDISHIKFAPNAADTWGNKAASELGRVKGKHFTKEKNKKKRATWTGAGQLDMSNHSVFFNSD